MTDAVRTDPTNPLSPGDALATCGEWPEAIAAWQHAATENPALRPAVERRLSWLVAESGQGPAGRSRVLPLVLAFLAATGLGMTLLAVAGTPGTARADLVAVATWALVALAVAAALIAARRSSGPSMDHLLARARVAAERLDRDNDSGETR